MELFVSDTYSKGLFNGAEREIGMVNNKISRGVTAVGWSDLTDQADATVQYEDYCHVHENQQHPEQEQAQHIDIWRRTNDRLNECAHMRSSAYRTECQITQHYDIESRDRQSDNYIRQHRAKPLQSIRCRAAL